MAKQAPKPKEEKKPVPKKKEKILKRSCFVPALGHFYKGDPVTKEMEKAWEDYYKKTAGKVIRPLDFYC